MGRNRIIRAREDLGRNRLMGLIRRRTNINVALSISSSARAFTINFIIRVQGTFSFLIIQRVDSTLSRLDLIRAVQGLNRCGLVIYEVQFSFNLNARCRASTSNFMNVTRATSAVGVSSNQRVEYLSMLRRTICISFVIVSMYRTDIGSFARIIYQRVNDRACNSA